MTSGEYVNSPVNAVAEDVSSEGAGPDAQRRGVELVDRPMDD